MKTLKQVKPLTKETKALMLEIREIAIEFAKENGYTEYHRFCKFHNISGIDLK